MAALDTPETGATVATPDPAKLEAGLLAGPAHRGTASVVLLVLAGAWILFHIVAGGLSLVPGTQLRAIHVGGALCLVFLWKPLKGRGLWAVDAALALASVVCTGYLVVFYDQIVTGTWFIHPEWEKPAGVLLLLCTLEGIRRILGWFFLGLVLVAGAYAELGPWIPGIFGHAGLSFDRLIYSFYLGSQGVTGMLVGISAGVVALFIVFGEVLTASGGGETFINIAMRVGGRYRGGAGLVAVIASGFMGMINGSAVANVTSTGVLTIPLMKRLGFNRDLAGATEAVASTGGQFMPPIMGPGAFLMAELLGISYVSVASAALLPSLLFYFGLLLNVYLFSVAHDLKPVPAEMIPSRRQTYAPGALAALLVPLGIVIGMVMARYTIELAGFCAILAATIVFVAGRVWTAARRPGPRAAAPAAPAPSAELGAFVQRAASGMAYVGMIILAAQMVMAVINLTGLGVTFSDVIVRLGAGNVTLSLILTMLVCFVLGMGMPTPAAYAVAAAVLAAPLTKLGFERLPAHLFIYYFACLAAITPPVAAAIFAAIAISGGSFLRTAGYCLVLSLGLYIIPFLFIENPVLTLQGQPLRVAVAALTAVLGVAALSAATIGWMGGRLGVVTRIALGVSAVLLLVPRLWTDAAGIMLAATVVVPRLLDARRGAAGLRKEAQE